MDKNLEAVRRAQVERTIKALAQNRIPAVYAPTREKAVEAVQSHCVASRGKNTHLIAPYIIGVGSDVRKETLDPFAERFTREAILINEPDSHSQTALFQEVFAFIGASVRDSLQGERDLGRLYERIRKNTVRKVSDMVYRVRGVL